MATTPFPLSTFRGLNLVDSVDSVGDQCIDCRDIDLDYSGTKVRSRDGYDNLTTAFTTDLTCLHRQNDSKLLASDSTTLYSINSAGSKTSLGTLTGLQAVNFGTPTETATYMAGLVSGTTVTLRKIVSTTLSAPTATVNGSGGSTMPLVQHIGVQEADNRLVVATPTGASAAPGGGSSSSSHLWFSEPGAPESWNTNNYVQLTPGDGENIQGIVTWRGQVFVFKQTRMFVFYGNSTDGAGNPIFNYRTVQIPSRFLSGLLGSPRTPVGEDGVYFTTADGVYVTTGDVPALLSEDLAPLATDQALPSYLTGINARFTDFRALHLHKRRLFLSLGGSTPGTLVYDLDAGTWVVWSIAPRKLATWEAEDGSGLLYFVNGSGNTYYIQRFKSSFTDDDGAAINSYYRTGFSDFGADEEKTVMDAQLWGTGTVQYSASKDFGPLGQTENVTLGTSPAIGHGYAHKAAASMKGTVFSQKYASVSGGAWALHRVVQNVEGLRPPGLRGS